VGAEKDHSVLLSIGRAWLTEPRMMLLAGLAVEKDNAIPSVDGRASGHEKRSQCKQSHSHHGFIADQEKVPGTLRCFVSEK